MRTTFSCGDRKWRKTLSPRCNHSHYHLSSLIIVYPLLSFFDALSAPPRRNHSNFPSLFRVTASLITYSLLLYTPDLDRAHMTIAETESLRLIPSKSDWFLHYLIFTIDNYSIFFILYVCIYLRKQNQNSSSLSP